MPGVFMRVVVVTSIVAGTTFISWILWPKVDYLPNGNRNLVFGILLPPPGYNQDELMNLGKTVESALQLIGIPIPILPKQRSSIFL